MKKAILIVLDSVGAGALPDAALYNDEGANTLGHIAEKMPLHIPNMRALGMGICPAFPCRKRKRALGLMAVPTKNPWARIPPPATGK